MTVLRDGEHETLFTHYEPAELVLSDNASGISTHIIFVNEITESEYAELQNRFS